MPLRLDLGNVRGQLERAAAGADGAVLELQGAMTPKTRTQYAAVQAGKGGAQTQDDAWQRSVSPVRALVVGWESAGVPYAGQKDLSGPVPRGHGRRAALGARRPAEHLAAWFPEVKAP